MNHAAAKTSSATPEQRLKELGLNLPEAAIPAANYVPFTVSGNVAYISGQLPAWQGKMFKTGQLGKEVTVPEGQETAKICALNVLAHLKNACGGELSRVTKVLKIEVLVNSAPGFAEQHVVANGASNLIAEAFGDKGKHARVAYGVAGLPLNVAVEVAATFEIR